MVEYTLFRCSSVYKIQETERERFNIAIPRALQLRWNLSHLTIHGTNKGKFKGGLARETEVNQLSVVTIPPEPCIFLTSYTKYCARGLSSL